MTDKFVVDVLVFASPPASNIEIILRNHRIKFEGRTIKVLEASSFETIREFDCSLVLNKPMKHPGDRCRTILSVIFAPSGGLQLAFYDSNMDYVGYVVEEFNKFLISNKDHVIQKRALIEYATVVTMIDKFVVDVMVPPNPPEYLSKAILKEHRISFEGRTIQVLNGSSFDTVRKYDSSLLLNKLLKHPNSQERERDIIILSIRFQNAEGIKLAFSGSNGDYAGYVVNKFNGFLEANQCQIRQSRAKIENIPTVYTQQSITPSNPTKKRRAEWGFEIEQKQDNNKKLICLDNTQQKEQIQDLNPNNEIDANEVDNLPVEKNWTIHVEGQIITGDKDALSAIEITRNEEVEDIRKARKAAGKGSKIDAVVEEDNSKKNRCTETNQDLRKK
ncbi:hypothetical protein GCK72_023571 [Caenorhabditis remanei]|uniref:Uncharacterized protein n=1 Tax=Caenorhabditis remanei TaxID=31234 RepID=A0A6A5FX59_CAERE|nr:hypothetical protein GCK72_023571 [Caenorhabditis remanei]KAF1747112.1 hypothetical protein GCK72_023571 [Caenorhabditis remanei]